MKHKDYPEFLTNDIPKDNGVFGLAVKQVLKELITETRKELPFSLRPKDLIELLPYGATRVYQMLESGEIPARKLGGKWVIPRDIFLTWYFGQELLTGGPVNGK